MKEIFNKIATVLCDKMKSNPDTFRRASLENSSITVTQELKVKNKCC